MDARRLPARGTKHYDLEGMPDEDFERLCARLVLLEFPLAVTTASTLDGGADVRLPGAGDSTERCWQAKHFPGKIHWKECKDSLAVAKKRWNPREYTFCFPRNLNEREQATFDKHFRSGEEIEVNQWNGEALLARLNGSDEGERVGRTFFKDPEQDADKIARALTAQGPLATTEDALNRLTPVGAFLTSEDAYFSYPAATHETGGAAPPVTPGAIMSVASVEGKVTNRIDAVPRDEEAVERYAPEVLLRTTADDAGERAANLLRGALERGESVRLDSGVEVSIINLPPGLEGVAPEHVVGGIVELGPAEGTRSPPPPPWLAYLQIETDEGQADLEVLLEPGGDAPEGWDHVLVGSYAGLEVRAVFRRRGDGGQIRFDFRYSFQTTAALHDRVEALHALRALHGEGVLVVADRGKSGRPDVRIATARSEFSEEWTALTAFVEDLSSISEWAKREVRLPEVVDRDTVRTIATVAREIREGGQLVRWSKVEPVVTSEGLSQLREGGQLLLEQTIAVQIGDQLVDLGFTRMVIDEYRIAEAVEQDGGYRVRVEPPDIESAEVFRTLHRPQKQRRRRPPESPRKAAKKSKRRGNRKHGRPRR